MERRGVAKSGLIFHAIESSDGFYEMPLVPSKNRSRMNVPFRIVGGPSVSEGRQRELTEEFLIRCWEEGLVGLRTMTPFFFASIRLAMSLYLAPGASRTVDRLLEVLGLGDTCFVRSILFTGLRIAASCAATISSRACFTGVVNSACLSARKILSAIAPSDEERVRGMLPSPSRRRLIVVAICVAFCFAISVSALALAN